MKRILIALVGLMLSMVNITYAQHCREKTRELLKLKGSIIKDSLIVLARDAICTCKTEDDTLYYIYSLNILSESYNGMSIKDSCLKYAKEAIKIYRQSSLKDDYLQGWLIKSLGNAYQNQFDYVNALSSYQEANVIFEKHLPPFEPATDIMLDMYLQCANDIALNFMYTQQFYKAKKQFDTFFSYLSKYPDAQSKMSLTLTNYAAYLDFMGEYEKALNYNKEALVQYKNYSKSNTLDVFFYSQLLNNVGYAYQQLGFYQYAEPYYQELFEIRSKLFGEKDEAYLNALNNLGSLYLNLHRNDEAITIFKKLDNLTAAFDKSNPLYGVMLSNLIVAYSDGGYKAEALIVAKRLVDLKRKSRMEHPSDFASAIAILGNTYRESGNYTQAIEMLREALNLYKIKKAEVYNPEPFIVKNNLGSAYISIGRYSEAIELYKDLVKNGDQRFKLSYLNNLIVSYAANKEMEKAITYIDQAFVATRTQMQNRIGILSNYEKEKYVSQIDELFQIYKSFLNLVPLSSRDHYNEMVYSNELLLKGFIVSNEQKMRRSIKESEDSTLIKQYDIWKENKRRLYRAEFINKDVGESELKTQTAEIERQLANKSKIFSNEILALNIDWKNVQSNLSENDIIVDFFFFREYSDKLKPTGNFKYGAFLLKKEYKFPLWIPLCSEKQLSNMLDIYKPDDTERERINSIYGDMDINSMNSKGLNIVNENLFKMIWQPIIPYLQNVTHIYFIPVNRLGALSLLSLHDGKDFLIDKYHFVQLQNAKDFINHETFENVGKDFKNLMISSQKSKTILFGGIQYNYKQEHRDSVNSPKIDSTKFYTDLPLTELEVNEISKLMNNNGFSAVVVDSLNATEDYFKSFDGNSPEIIHIATHGYFNSLPDKVNMSTENTLADQVFKFSKNPFLRAGLLFSYGNYTLGGGKFSDHREDGILTAEEISVLDLSNTNLLVLSACETGVGDIAGSEGVFGLQRAFKIAGVRHMIVSLWKVSEKATKKFMEIFYQQYLEGKGLYNAFQETQKIMKKSYNPYFWGGFILVQ